MHDTRSEKGSDHHLSGAKCYHMTFRPSSDWLISKAYFKATRFNLIEIGADNPLYSGNNNEIICQGMYVIVELCVCIGN